MTFEDAIAALGEEFGVELSAEDGRTASFEVSSDGGDFEPVDFMFTYEPEGEMLLISADAGAVDLEGGDVLGYPIAAVSAEHGRGIEGLLEMVLPHLPKEEPGAAEAEGERPLRVAVAGRPNAGKSSYINRLTRQQRLVVSDVPGTTRDCIEVPFELESADGGVRKYVLVDTAGMRKKRSAKNSVETFSVFRAQRAIAEADLVVLAVDALEGPGEQEKKISGLIREARKLVLPRQGVAGHIDLASHAVGKLNRFFEPVVFKISGGGAHAEFPAGQIDGVRAVAQRHLKPLPIPGGGEQLQIVTNNSVKQQRH